MTDATERGRPPGEEWPAPTTGRSGNRTIREGGTGVLNTDGEYVPLSIGPDPARDARVAARRAEDARKAGAALVRLLADRCDGLRCTCCGQLSDLQDAVRDALSQRHHNGHYGVTKESCYGADYAEDVSQMRKDEIGD